MERKMQFGKEPAMFGLFYGFPLKKKQLPPTTQNTETHSNNISKLEVINMSYNLWKLFSKAKLEGTIGLFQVLSVAVAARVACGCSGYSSCCTGGVVELPGPAPAGYPTLKKCANISRSI